MDKLEFRIVKASELNEEWYKNMSPDAKDKMMLVKIFINGIDLMDTVAEIEKPYLTEEGWGLDSPCYGHNTTRNMCWQLNDLTDSESYSSKYGIELFCCYDCGLGGCWSVECFFRFENDKVYMERFSQNHRDWNYDLKYCFSRENYDNELKRLNKYNTGTINGA